MFSSLPSSALDILTWEWPQAEPYYHDLETRELSAANVEQWLLDWTQIGELMEELSERLYVATTVDTTDQQADQRYVHFLDDIHPLYEAAEQRLKEKLLASGLEPVGMEIPLRNMRAEAALYREENLPLISEEKKLTSEYDRIIGAQTVMWEGKEVTLSQLTAIYLEPDRAKRERAWRLSAERRLQDREAINALWIKFMALRKRIASNADAADYRAYKWRENLRFDYTPEDAERFDAAIEAVVVPAASRVLERRRKRLGLATLRPWDMEVDPDSRPPLRPYQTLDQLNALTSAIFHRVDRQLGGYFDVMRREGLLDMDNRKGKGPGGYCTVFSAVRRPFIFMNAVGVHEDVTTLLHEGGHAFHDFEAFTLPYRQQRDLGSVPMEFCEVASMSMELLGAPYFTVEQGGFYTEAEAARARIEHLESIILFWPYMAIVDAFQHWVYTHHDAASDPANCDAKWLEIWRRFRPDWDWSGLDDSARTWWHRQIHIHQIPFYYIEYGLAQLGAVQVWRNALHNQAEAVANYRKALALGGTVTLPQLFATAGAKFALDAATLGEAVTLIEDTIEHLSS